MIIKTNPHLDLLGDAFTLQIVANGNALCGTDWCAAEPSPPYTRLYYIAEGEATIKTQQGTTALETGCVYLLPAGFPFSYACDHRMRQLYFHVNLLGGEGWDLLRGVPQLLQMHVGDAYIAQLLALHASNEITDRLYLKSLLGRDIFALLSKHHLQLKEPHCPDCVTNALRFIEQNLSVALTVEQVAAAVFASPHTLAHKFKHAMSVPIGQYIDELVLFKAEQLLLGSDLPLSAISDTLGFCDQFYFSRRFRERFGVPPLQYRKQHQ